MRRQDSAVDIVQVNCPVLASEEEVRVRGSRLDASVSHQLAAARLDFDWDVRDGAAHGQRRVPHGLLLVLLHRGQIVHGQCVLGIWFAGPSATVSSSFSCRNSPTQTMNPEPGLNARCLILPRPASQLSCTPGLPKTYTLPSSVPTASRLCTGSTACLRSVRRRTAPHSCPY